MMTNSRRPRWLVTAQLAPSRGRKNRRGSALVLSLFAVFLVAGLAASFLRLSMTTSRRQAAGIEQKRAFYLAEAGLTEAVAGIYRGRTGNIGTLQAPARYGDGVFYVEATDLEDDLVQVDATGMQGSADALLSLVVRRGRPAVAHLGMFGASGLEIQPGTFIDGYESSAGPYDPAAAAAAGLGSMGGVAPVRLQRSALEEQLVVQQDSLLELTGDVAVGEPEPQPEPQPDSAPADKMMIAAPIGSNGSVTLTGTTQAPTYVDGIVTGGIGNLPETVGEVVVTGGVASRTSPVLLPQIEAPARSLDPGVTVSSGAPHVLSVGDTGLESLTVAPSAEVVVQGPGTLVLGALELGAEATLQFDPGAGSLDVYVLNGFSMAATSSMVVNTEDPTRTSLLFPNEMTEPIELAGAGEFHGLIYAPQGDLRVGSGFEVFGSLVADTLTFLEAARYHFDASLAEASMEASRPQVVSWRTVEMESAGPAGQSVFVRLGLDVSLLTDASECHADQFLEVRYRPAGQLFFTTYAGPEVDFDWTQVAEVDAVSRDGVEVPEVRKVWRMSELEFTTSSAFDISPGF